MSTAEWWIQRLEALPYTIIQAALITLWFYALYVFLFDRKPPDNKNDPDD